MNGPFMNSTTRKQVPNSLNQQGQQQQPSLIPLSGVGYMETSL